MKRVIKKKISMVLIGLVKSVTTLTEGRRRLGGEWAADECG
jgi:hypothetical protein